MSTPDVNMFVCYGFNNVTAEEMSEYFSPDINPVVISENVKSFLDDLPPRTAEMITGELVAATSHLDKKAGLVKTDYIDEPTGSVLMTTYFFVAKNRTAFCLNEKDYQDSGWKFKDHGILLRLAFQIRGGDE
jgi:hypothetical protein